MTDANMNSNSKGSLPSPSDARRSGGQIRSGMNPSTAQTTEAFPAFDPTITSNESYDVNAGNTSGAGFARYAGDDSNALNRLIAASTKFIPPQPKPTGKRYRVGTQYRLVGDVRNVVVPAIPKLLSQAPQSQPGLNPYSVLTPTSLNPYSSIPSTGLNYYPQRSSFGFNANTAAFVPMNSPSHSPPGIFNANTPEFVPAFVPGGSPSSLANSSSSSSLVQASNDKFAFRSKPPVAPRAMVQEMLNQLLQGPYTQQDGNTKGALVPSGPSPIRHFTTRFDKKLKDIVITHEGVFYNAVRVEQQTFLDGTIETETFHDFDLENGYNILDELAAMSPQERANFFSDKFAEIVVDGPYIEAFYTGLEALAAYMKEHKKVDSRATTEILGGVKLDDSPKGKEKEITSYPKTVLDILALLGADFSKNCRNLFIRIIFPPSSAPAQTPLAHPVIHHYALAKSQSARPSAGAIDCGTTPLLWHLTCLIDPLNTFTNLHRCDITLQTPAGCPRPVTLEHMDHILPFYDLESFLGWQVWWTHECFTHPERVQAWPMEQCACEWVKICVQRDAWWEEIEGAVFVTKSVHRGPGTQVGGASQFGGGGKGKGKYGGPHERGAAKRGRYR